MSQLDICQSAMTEKTAVVEVERDLMLSAKDMISEAVEDRRLYRCLLVVRLCLHRPLAGSTWTLC